MDLRVDIKWLGTDGLVVRLHGLLVLAAALEAQAQIVVEHKLGLTALGPDQRPVSLAPVKAGARPRLRPERHSSLPSERFRE